jgi:hypothetical protein
MHLQLRRTARVAANLFYTLQFAGGTGSTSTSQPPGVDWIQTYVAPLDFDQRHTGSLNVDVRFNEDDGPAIAGFKPFASTGFNLLMTFGSGFPYTPSEVTTDPALPYGLTYGAINSAYGPWNIQIDMRIDRTFQLMGLEFNVYLLAINALGIRNWNSREIYPGTGNIADNGFLSSPAGKTWMDENGGEPAANLYRLITNTPDHWSVPRQLRFGVRLNIMP